MTPKIKLYIGLLVLGLAVAGCGLWFLFNPLTADKPDNTNNQACAVWQAVSINGSKVIDGIYVSLYLHNDGSFQGNGGCDKYGGSYSLNALGKIILFDFFKNNLGCSEDAEDITEQEITYLECLHKATSYSMTGSYMDLYDNSGQILVLFKRSPAYPMDHSDLIDTNWLLVRKNGIPLSKSESSILIFDETGGSGRSSGKGYRDFYMHSEFTYEACGDIIIVTGASGRSGAKIPPELIDDTAECFHMPVGVFTYHLTQDSLELYITPDLTYTFLSHENRK